jgi:hypothetical protein
LFAEWSDVDTIDKSVIYYPVFDTAFDDFIGNITDRGFKLDSDGDNCYKLDDKTVAACWIDMANDERSVMIYLDNVTMSTTNEDVIAFFPKIDAPLSARSLNVEFNSNKSAVFASFATPLKETLGFELYNNSDSHYSCFKKYDGDIVYVFCYIAQDNYYSAEWSIAAKALFDIIF